MLVITWLSITFNYGRVRHITEKYLAFSDKGLLKSVSNTSLVRGRKF